MSDDSGPGFGHDLLQRLRKLFRDRAWVRCEIYKKRLFCDQSAQDDSVALVKYDSTRSYEKIDFHGLQLVPFGQLDAARIQEPMDIHPASKWHISKFVERYGGFFPTEKTIARSISAFDELDLVRRDMLVLLMRSVIQRDVNGDFAELGVFRGITAKLIHRYVPDRPLHLFDTFAGFDDRDLKAEPTGTNVDDARIWFRDTNMAEAMRYICPINSNVHIHQGFFPESIPAELKRAKFAFVHLDVDLYAPIRAGLDFFYERLSPGGFMVVHDYNAWFGSRQAVDEFFRHKAEVPLPMPDKSGSVVIAKQ